MNKSKTLLNLLDGKDKSSLLYRHFKRHADKIASIMRDEIGSDDAIEVRQDPKVSGTWAILNSDKAGIIIRVNGGHIEALDTFELEDDQKSLKDIPVGDVKFSMKVEKLI